MCTHATARAIKCSPDRFALFVSAEDERTRTRSDAELFGPAADMRARARDCFGARPIKRSLYDCARCERAPRAPTNDDSNQRGILRFHARESRRRRRSRFPACVPAKFGIFGQRPAPNNKARTNVFPRDVKDTKKRRLNLDLSSSLRLIRHRPVSCLDRHHLH